MRCPDCNRITVEMRFRKGPRCFLCGREWKSENDVRGLHRDPIPSDAAELDALRDRVSEVVMEAIGEWGGSIQIDISIHGASERMMSAVAGLRDSEFHRRCSETGQAYNVAKTPPYTARTVITAFGPYRKLIDPKEAA